MHLLRLKLLHPMVNEQMRLQEYTIFGLEHGVKVTRDVAQHTLHHVTYAFAKFGVASSNGKGMH